MKGVDGMDKAKILRLLDEADDIVSALYRQGANKDYKCKSLREKLKAIAAEISEPPKTNADRIRQMTDEELAEQLGSYICDNRDSGDCQRFKNCEDCKMSWIRQEVSEDADK
jgi:hypothetical protein